MTQVCLIYCMEPKTNKWKKFMHAEWVLWHIWAILAVQHIKHKNTKIFIWVSVRNGEGNTTEENLCLVPNPNVLVALSKDMWAQNPPVLNCGCQLTQIARIMTVTF